MNKPKTHTAIWKKSGILFYQQIDSTSTMLSVIVCILSLPDVTALKKM